MTLILLFSPNNKEEIKQAYISKLYFNHENKVIVFMMVKKCHYLPINSLPRLLQEITSNHNNDYYYMHIIMCGYSLFTQCSFDNNKDKFDYYRGKECVKKLTMKKRKCYH